MIGVVLAGGKGTRLFPATRVTNKHLLPIYDRPMIYYPLQSLAEAGIKDVCIVVGDLSAGEILHLIGNGKSFGFENVYYVYQQESGGIAHALGLVEKFVNRDDMVVMLGDNIFTSTLAGIVDAYRTDRPDCARIVLTEVDNPAEFGVVEFTAENRKSIKEIIEKPKNPPSNFIVTGLYFYPPSVFSVIRTLHPSNRHELEITDVNNYYAHHDKLAFSIFSGKWLDAGTFDAMSLASSYFADVGKREKINGSA